jgi:tetratricopeptide (TPR) repeat protein
MISLLFLLFAPAANDVNATERLIHCIEIRDKNCLAAELKSAPSHGSPEYLSAMAEGYLLLGRTAKAIAAIESALKEKPGDYGLLMQQGRTYQRIGDQVHAIQSFLLAAKIKPSSTLFYQMGMSFFLAHEYERAGKHFTHAVQLDDQNHKAEFMLGVVDVLRDHNEQGAKVHFERALAMEPDNPHYLLHYGIVLSELDDGRALSVLEKAVKADPTNALGHYNLGRRYRRVGDLQKARAELEIAVHMRPQLARAQYQLAAVYRELGEIDKANQAGEQFIKFKDQDRDDDPIDVSGPSGSTTKRPNE